MVSVMKLLVAAAVLASAVVLAGPAGAIVGPTVLCVNDSDPGCGPPFTTIQAAVTAASGSVSTCTASPTRTTPAWSTTASGSTPSSQATASSPRAVPT